MDSKIKQGYIHVYTGNGKGKTTAALGLGMRAWGQGYRVFFIQFMKRNTASGELKAVQKLGRRFRIRQFGSGRFVRNKPCVGDKKEAKKTIEFAKRVVKSGLYDIVILDEVNCALKYNLIKGADLKEIIRSKPFRMELILTGRYAPKWLFTLADLVTEMKERKHYFGKKINARCGIEY